MNNEPASWLNAIGAFWQKPKGALFLSPNLQSKVQNHLTKLLIGRANRGAGFKLSIGAGNNYCGRRTFGVNHK